MREDGGKTSISMLSDNALVQATHALVGRSNEVTAELLSHLAEVDSRKLYLEQAQPSMFAWCVAELACSEDVACNWIAVARASRSYPLVLDVLREGKVHLTGLRLLARHLTRDGHRALLKEAAGKSRRQIEEIVARIAPRPAVASSIRKLPEQRPVSGPKGAAETSPGVTSLPEHRTNEVASACDPARASDSPGVGGGDQTSEGDVEGESGSGRCEGAGSDSEAGAKPRSFRPRASGRVEPLSADAYRVTFTASRGLRDKIRQAQDLLGHQVQDGDLAAVVERGLDLLIEEVKKRRFAVGRKRGAGMAKRPKTKGVSSPETRPPANEPEPGATGVENNAVPSATTATPESRTPQPEQDACAVAETPKHRAPRAVGGVEPDARNPKQRSLQEEGRARAMSAGPRDARDDRSSRYIPAEIRRAVFERDGGQCTFVDDRGRRCPEQRRLEFDHAAGFARVGVHSVAGLRLRCRPHNEWHAERLYGRSFMEKKRAAGR